MKSIKVTHTYTHYQAKILTFLLCYGIPATQNKNIIVVVQLLSRVQLYNRMDCSLPGSSVHGMLQARILEWVAMPSSRGSSRPRDPIWVS